MSVRLLLVSTINIQISLCCCCFRVRLACVPRLLRRPYQTCERYRRAVLSSSTDLFNKFRCRLTRRALCGVWADLLITPGLSYVTLKAKTQTSDGV